jgi:hypothetical protein
LYGGAQFQSGQASGPAITVAAGSEVEVYVSLNATGNMRGELRTEVWTEATPPPGGPEETCSKAPTLFTGNQAILACDFTAMEPSARYYLKVYWNGSPLTEQPIAGQMVTTLPG